MRYIRDWRKRTTWMTIHGSYTFIAGEHFEEGTVLKVNCLMESTRVNLVAYQFYNYLDDVVVLEE